MSGTPTASEIQTQWKNALIILEKLRAIADSAYVGASGFFDDLDQVLEGTYTPASLTGAMSRFRAGLSQLVSDTTAREFLDPCLFEYARLLGWPQVNPADIARKLAEYFDANSQSTTSRAITFASTGTAGGSNVGNGVLLRLTVNQYNEPIENVTAPDTKTFRCIADASSGANRHAELFSVESLTSSPDWLGLGAAGSGISQRTIRALHCGTGEGGSWLRNGSFSTYSASATPKFDGWTEVSSGASLAQDAVNFYRSHPGASTDASLRMNATGGSDITIRQAFANLRVRQFNPDVPMVLSVMVNKTVGSGASGDVTLRIGSSSVDTSVASIGSGWQRITVPFTEDCWHALFNDGTIDVELTWEASGSGYLLFDDMILHPMTEIDGTYFALFGGSTPFVAKDLFTVADTGGTPGTGIINHWLWRAGYVSLPVDGSPTFADPTIP